MSMFELSDEQEMMVDTTRKLVREKIIEPRIDMKLDQSGEFPTELAEDLFNAGIMNVEIPESYGGAGLSCLDHALIQEELNYGCTGITTTLIAASLASLPVMIADNEALRKKYLPTITEGKRYAAYACSEPDAGSDVANLSTTYTKNGDTYVLNGQKRWITNGNVADWYVVFAREVGSKGHKGIAAFVVDANGDGVRWDSKIDKLGQRASPTCDIIFEDAPVPAANLLAGPDHGFKLAMATFDRSRPWIAAAGTGLIRRCRDESLHYALDRKTFGVPIIQHQMIQSMISEMEIAYQASRHLTLFAAYQVTQGHLRGSHSACAKAYSADQAMKAATDAVQVFGGYGYTKEFVVEKLMRDAKLLQIYEGTSQIQRMVIARDLVRDAQQKAG